MTRPLPNDASVPASPPRTAAERERARVKVARKWAYLISTTTYVPLVHTDLERPLLEIVEELFTALAADPLDLEVADRAGARLVELNCVDKSSLQCTIDVLAGPLLTDPDVAHVSPEQAARLLGALAAGFATALRQRTVEQQDSMCRALMEVARKAMRAAETRQSEFGEMSTELSLLQRQLSHQLLHDALTGLPNRQFFTTRLEEVLNSGSPTTLYRIELNGFAVLNDGLGGPPTDTMLIAVASRLRSAVAGEPAMLARFDRASFAVLHEHAPNGPTPTEIVDRITLSLAGITYVSGLGLAMTANIGVVQSPPHGSDPVEFLQTADVALRLAKEQGPGHWRMVTPDEGTADRKLLRFAAAMPGALESGQLVVGYGLRVNLADEQPIAVDAYARWDKAGLTGQDCVALAEQTGLSPQVSRWLLRAAGERVRTSRTRLALAVSLSPNQSVAPDLVDTVLSMLTDMSLPAERLRLALPAPEVFDGRPEALENLTALANAGVRTAVHDFGGNPSDVVRLPDLPSRAVSLAPRLVAQARSVGRKDLVTKAVMSLTELVHEAGATVSVDDVRTEPEATWWREAGADTATGPMFPIKGQP